MVWSHLIISQEKRFLAVFGIHTNTLVPVTTNIYRAVFFLDSEVPGKVYLSLATGLCQRLLDNCHQRISPEAEQFQISPGEVLKALFISLSH